MACLELDFSQQTFEEPFILQLEESISAEILAVPEASTSSLYQNNNIPKPPPLPGVSHVRNNFPRNLSSYSYVPKEIKNSWDRLFKEGYGADVHFLTDEKEIILAHSCVLNTASPVLRNLLNQAKIKGGFHCIKIPGVPSVAVSAFVRFLYSSCYEQNVMRKYILHLLVLSHTFSVPPLKQVCINQLEKALLTTENVIDVLQLARECDAPRLSLFCIRQVVMEFKKVSASEGWKVMRQSNPSLEQELLECLVEADTITQEKVNKKEEKKMYLQLYEAMEALLHICKDGCRTIGPRDKMPKGNQVTCNFPACKGLESLVRHFSACKTRVPGGCTHCKRTWQLFELHSRMCDEPDFCKVPLCRLVIAQQVCVLQ
uniref:BTB/POZ and TAZ domain-containing protein 3 n=1 Tax=Anthurium amnicola TaxID=1678845 RepID=A0A1D1YW41_9ARAE